MVRPRMRHTLPRRLSAAMRALWLLLALLAAAARAGECAPQAAATTQAARGRPGSACLRANEPCQSAQQCCDSLSCLPKKAGQPAVCVGVGQAG